MVEPPITKHDVAHQHLAAPRDERASSEIDAAGSADDAFSARSMLITLALDMGLALVAYYALRLFGVSQYLSLLVAAVVAGLRMIYVAVKTKDFGIFSGFLLVVFGVGLALSFFTGSPTFLLIKESFGTGVAGSLFLGSCVVRRPLIYYAARRALGANSHALVHRWETQPESHRPFYLMSIVWGVGLLVEAAIRIPLVFVLPIDIMAGLSTAMFAVVMAGLSLWNVAYVKRLRQAERRRLN